MSNNLWGQIDQESLVAQTLDEALEEYVLRLHEEAGPDVCLPETVSFAEYEPMKLSQAGLNPLETLLENLDDECLMFDWSKPTKPTEAMKVAEEAFLDAVLSEYKTQAYQEVAGSKTVVNVREWQQQRLESTA